MHCFRAFDKELCTCQQDAVTFTLFSRVLSVMLFTYQQDAVTFMLFSRVLSVMLFTCQQNMS